MIIAVYIIGGLAGMFGAASLFVGIDRSSGITAYTGLLLLILGVFLFTNAQPITTILTGGTA